VADSHIRHASESKVFFDSGQDICDSDRGEYQPHDATDDARSSIANQPRGQAQRLFGHGFASGRVQLACSRVPRPPPLQGRDPVPGGPSGSQIPRELRTSCRLPCKCCSWVTSIGVSFL
jgi:hypothetical protein